MIQTSSRFHEAIREGQPQFPLFLFDDGAMVLPEDIDLDSGGFTFDESAADSDDYMPGVTPAASLVFNILNSRGAWNDFGFGEFTALLGVRVETLDAYDTQANCYIKIGNTVLEGWSKSPHLTLNGSAVSGVNKPVLSMLLNDSRLYAFTDEGYYIIQYTGSMIAVLQHYDGNSNLYWNSRRWNREGRSRVYKWKWANADTNVRPENCLIEFIGSSEHHYEMVPLGIFNAERPVFSSEKTMRVECFDRMTKFDENYDASKFQYPMTLLSLASAVADAVDVPYAAAESGFVNATLTVNSPDLKESTYRDLLRYIGELSGTYARITRDGKLRFVWLRSTNMTLTRHDYTDCQTGYYEVPIVDKVVIRDYNADDIESGDGMNIVYISNNPLAGGGS